MTDETARTVRGLLRGVVESGTAESASLATFDVAGKTGTAKRTEHGRYVAGKYTASFVGLFPADDPQLVILVKLDDPSSSIYGGKAAAPVSKTVLQAAIAARDASLDRRNLAAVPRRVESNASLPDSVTSADSVVRVTESGSVPYVYRLDSPRKRAVAAVAARAIPDVRGLPVRRAVYALHRAGFRVSLATVDAAGRGDRDDAARGRARDRRHDRATAARAVRPVRLAELTDALARAGLLVITVGALPESVTAISDDSRTVGPGSLFVAVRGSARDGHDYLEAAARAGAAAAIVEDPARSALPAIVVRDGRRAAAVAAAAFYGEPARGISFIGVTGTNGKTTTVGMLRHLLDEPGARSASIGTLGTLVGSRGEPLGGGGTSLTTPGPIELQRTLRALADAGVRTVAMEASSHALEQRRVEGVRFDAAVFTNLTRDHLDYHGDMEAYFAAKASLVGYLAHDGVAIVNADDAAWERLPPPPRRVTFGVANDRADVRAEEVRYDSRGSSWRLVAPGSSAAVRLPLIGDFNVANALGAAAAAYALGVPRRQDRAPAGGAAPGTRPPRDHRRAPDRAARLRAHAGRARARPRGAASVHARAGSS